jgi:hypothetical protein
MSVSNSLALLSLHANRMFAGYSSPGAGLGLLKPPLILAVMLLVNGGANTT